MKDFALILAFAIAWAIAGAIFALLLGYSFFQIGLSFRWALWGGLINLGLWAGVMFLITLSAEGRKLFFEGGKEEEGLSFASCLVFVLFAAPVTCVTVSLIALVNHLIGLY